GSASSASLPLLPVRLVNLIGLLPLLCHVLLTLACLLEVIIAGELHFLHGLQALLRALVGVCAVGTDAVSP
ncbi:hypothetical protein GN956_G16746, partial [Arapaima gigas]